MNIARASGAHFIADRNALKADTATAAPTAELPEQCNRFLGTQKSAHLASSILNELGGEPDPAALARMCFEQVANS